MTNGDQHALPIDPDLVELPPALLRDRRLRHRAERSILAVIAVAGIAGSLARYAMSRLIVNPPGHFPWSTFWINISGSLVIGFVLILLIEHFPLSRLARPMIATGFLGAYTTFSTYVVDADLLFRAGHLATAVAYTLSSFVVGAIAVMAGVILARVLIRHEHRLRELLR